jgi:2-succinyl-6-hydroxy-2,4-cyclohexadiene-1-carboxylate synthase
VSVGTPRPLGLTVTGPNARPAVLFLHGFMGSKAEWTGVTNALDCEFRCVAVDLPGHGVSTGLPDERYTVEGAAEAVLRVLDRLEIPRAVLVGYSMGGRLALYLALRHPDRCAGLFLESASPGLEDAGERAARCRADEGKAALLEGGDLRGFLHYWYRQPLFAPLARDEDLLRRTIEDKTRNDPAELAKSLQGMGTGRQPSLWGELPDLRVPALAVAGGLDEKFVGISRRMASINAGMRSAVVPDAGHNVHAEAPGAYLSLLGSFLPNI